MPATGPATAELAAREQKGQHPARPDDDHLPQTSSVIEEYAHHSGRADCRANPSTDGWVSSHSSAQTTAFYGALEDQPGSENPARVQLPGWSERFADRSLRLAVPTGTRFLVTPLTC